MAQIVKKGLLSKRCRWSWRPRYVELTSTPSDISASLIGPQFGYLLLIYDQSYRSIKNKVLIEDIVTIRAGKNYSFQIYLNSGMFLFFRTASAEDQAAWMADLKMALGKGSAQFHVRVTASSANNLILDHALLYCIGVNLPSHSFGQSDRVLVVASPVNDVNIHAWNLSRVKRFVIIDAGIQMELCSSCVGSRQKNTITFLLPVEHISNCMTFLLHEMHAGTTQPHQVMANGPTVYDVPHCCSVNPNPTGTHKGGEPPPYCNEAELAVLRPQELITRPVEDTAPHHLPRRHFTISTTSTQTHDFFDPRHVPPRHILRSDYSHVDMPQPTLQDGATDTPPHPYLNFHTSVSHTTPKTQSNFETPYHISQRIYINDNGTVTRESQVLGSGSGEFRRQKRSTGGHNPVYISTDDIASIPSIPTRTDDSTVIDESVTAPSKSSSHHTMSLDPKKRPDFIGKRRPLVPPRCDSPPLSLHNKQRSFSEPGPSDDVTIDYQNLPEGGHSPPPLPPPPPPSSHPLPLSQSSSSSSSPRSSPIMIHTEVEYVNVANELQKSSVYGSNSSLCTDDKTNAEFALMTRVSFKNIITPCLPPRSPGEPKRPMPLPRQYVHTKPDLTRSAGNETKSSTTEQIPTTKKPVPIPRSNRRTQQITTTIQQSFPPPPSLPLSSSTSSTTKMTKISPKRNPSPPDYYSRPRSLSYVNRSGSNSEGSLRSTVLLASDRVTSSEY